MALWKNVLKAIGFTIAGVFAFILGIVVLGYTLALLLKSPLSLIGVILLCVAVGLTIKFQNDDKEKSVQAEKNGQP